MTNSRMCEAAKKLDKDLFANLLLSPESKFNESAFAKLLDTPRLIIPLQFLWKRLRSQEFKKTFDKKTYEAEVDRALNLSPKIEAIEVLLCPTRDEEKKISDQKVNTADKSTYQSNEQKIKERRFINQSPNQIRDRLIHIFTTYQDDDSIKSQIVSYVNSNPIIKTSPALEKSAAGKKAAAEEQSKLEKFKKDLDEKWRTTRFNRAMFGLTTYDTYSKIEVEFFKALAFGFSAQTKLEIARNTQFDEKKSLWSKEELTVNSLAYAPEEDPFTELDKMFKRYEQIFLPNLINEFKKTQLPKSILHNIDIIKDKIKQQINEYKNFAKIHEEKLNQYLGEKHASTLEKELEKEKNKEKSLNAKLKEYRSQLVKEFKLLSELKSEDLINISKLDIKIEFDINTYTQEINDLKHKYSRNFYKETFQKIDTCKKEIERFEKQIMEDKEYMTLSGKGGRDLQALVSSRASEFKILCKSITHLSHSPSHAQFARELESTSYYDATDPVLRACLKDNLNDQVQSIVQPLEYTLESQKNMCDSKYKLLLNKLFALRKSDSKTNHPPSSKELSAKLANLLNEKATFYLEKMEKMRKDKVDELFKHATSEISREWTMTLHDVFQKNLLKEQDDFKLKKLDSILQSKNDENFVKEFLKNFRKKEEEKAKIAFEKAHEENILTIKGEDGQSPESIAKKQYQEFLAKQNLDILYAKPHIPITTSIKKEKSTNTFKTALAVIFFPAALFAGAKEIYKTVKFQLGIGSSKPGIFNNVVRFFRNLVPIVTGFLGSLIPPFGFYSYYLGLKRIYAGKSIVSNKPVLTLDEERVPLLKKEEQKFNSTARIIKETPPASETNTWLNFNTMVPMQHQENENIHIFIDTDQNERKTFCITPSTKTCTLQNHFEFKPPATELFRKILTYIKNPTDLTIENIDDPNKSIIIKVKDVRLKISCHASNDDNVLFIPETKHGNSWSIVQSHFINKKLYDVLYPLDSLTKESKTPVIQARPSLPRTSARCAL